MVQDGGDSDAADGREARQKLSGVAPAAAAIARAAAARREKDTAAITGPEEEHRHRDQDVGEGGQEGPPVVPEGARLFLFFVFSVCFLFSVFFS